MKKTINITIEAQFGSEFQEEFALNSLDGILKGWMLYLHNSHKKNKILIINNSRDKSLEEMFGGEIY